MKSSYFVIGISAFLLVISGMRFTDFEVPVIVIVLFSLMATFITVSDFLEMIKVKRGRDVPLIIAVVLFFVALVIWVIGNPINVEFAPRIGDGSAIFGLCLGVAMIGIKEIRNIKMPSIKHYKELQFEIIEYDYKKMLELNKTFESLKDIDSEVLTFDGQVHDGWMLFETSLNMYAKDSGPFVDGIHQNAFYEFLKSLDNYTGLMASACNPYPIRSVGRNITVQINGKIENITRNNMSDVEYDELRSLAQTCYQSWEEFRTLINSSYNKGHARSNKN
ncbi:hypothetical protein C1N61_29790 (plasmid) [Priestia aryabhattai]